MAHFKADDDKLNEVCSTLKGILTSFGGELPMKKIDGEYRTVVGNSIPYRELKHGTLASFLQSIPNVLKLHNRGGELVLVLEKDANIDIILRQVQEQDVSKYKKTAKKKRTQPATRQLHATNFSKPNNTHWQNNWSTLPQWQNPYVPSRARYSYSYQMPQQASAAAVHPVSTYLQRVTPQQQEQHQKQKQDQKQQQQRQLQQTTKSAPKPVPLLQNETVKTNVTSVANKTPAMKTYKEQLIEAVQELAASQGTTKSGPLVPTFVTMPCSKLWCTVIKIGDIQVSSYPDLMNTKEEAEEVAAKKALQENPQLAKKRQGAKLPTNDDYAVSIAQVKELLKENSPKKRFWWDALQNMYSDKHKEKLPQDWLTTVKSMSHTGLVFDNPCIDKWTVALQEKNNDAGLPEIKNTPPPPHQRFEGTEPSLTSKKSDKEKSSMDPAAHKPQLPPLSLPTTPTWDVFITCVEDANSVQLLLVGEDYSGMYSELLTEMELHYMEEKNQQPIKDPEVGEIYVASHEESWYRVEVLEAIGDEVKVKFVDHGDSEIIPLSNLYHLQEKFFSLPPQALKCCLAGMEDAPREAAFQALMDILPMGKTLVARVQRRQEPYALILFDTSTKEDINLNEKVFEAVSQHLVEPSLPPVGGLAEVYLTHILPDGTLYIQVESKTYKILDDLLKIAKRRTEEILGENVLVDLTKLYLARFSKNGEWYRAAPRSKVDPNGNVEMRFVDFGNSEKVPLTNIRGLQKLSPLLEKVPHQALACRLHNVPADKTLKWTRLACERLMDLTAQDTPLLLKVVCEATENEAASVQLFKRLLPQNELVSINDTLGINIELFSSEGDSNNNSVENDAVVSQLRSHQSSCVSDVISQSLPLKYRQAGVDSFNPCFPLSLSDIPDVGAYFDVFVTFAANPNTFAVQPWKMGNKLDELSKAMQRYYSNPANLLCVTAVDGGQYCAVKHSDGKWYRAKLEAVMDSSTVAGVFVDFGDRFVSTLEKVQPLPPDFCTIPCLAIKAKLHGIAAANRDWSPEDACRFQELAENRNLVSLVHGKEMESTGVLLLSLLLIDTSDKTVDTYINQVLVEEHRAILV